MKKLMFCFVSLLLIVSFVFALTSCSNAGKGETQANSENNSTSLPVSGDQSEKNDKQENEAEIIKTNSFFYSTYSMNALVNLDTNPENPNNLFEYNNYLNDCLSSAHPTRAIILYKDEEEGSFKLLDLEKLEVRDYTYLDAENIYNFSISPSGKYLMTVDGDFKVTVFDFESGEVIKKLNSDANIYEISWSPIIDTLACHQIYSGDISKYQICTYSADSDFNEQILYEYESESSPDSFDFRYWVDNDKFLASIAIKGSSENINKYCWIFDVTNNSIEKLQGYYPGNDLDYSFAVNGADEYTLRVLELHGISDIDFNDESNPTTTSLKDICMDIDTSPIYFDKDNRMIILPGNDGLEYRADTKKFSNIGLEVKSFQNCSWFFTKDKFYIEDNIK